MSRRPDLKTALNYKKAGVDITSGDELVERIKPLCAETYRSGVIAGLGGFASLFRLADLNYQNPLLVSATDGVGTKLKLAQAMNQYDTIGIDLVAMCVNDVLVTGAEPIFFLDYFACGKLVLEQAEEIIKGIAAGCKESGCALIGGETAEMPGMYPTGEYDMAGFCVGVVEEEAICGAQRVNYGDRIIGLASSGVHSNGFSLVRSIIEKTNKSLDMDCHGEQLGKTLLEPTKIYVKSLLPLIRDKKIHAMAHITGGGLTENLPRVLNPNQAAHLYRKQWRVPSIFDWLQEAGDIDPEEMLRVFNCGIGMVAIVAADHCDAVLAQLNHNDCAAYTIGEIEETAGDACVVFHE